MDTADNNIPRIFYHGTSLYAAERIFQQGFRVWLSDEGGERYCSGGNLGTGIYITCNWRVALWFGSTLLRVGLQAGTCLLDASEPSDSRIIGQLQRKFGREILRKPPWQTIPRNKHLKLHELINLFRYHYQKTWEKDYGRGRGGFSKWTRQRELHCRLLDDFRSVLIRYGFHGYGNPKDDNGIVVFAGDRIILKELIAEVPSPNYNEALKTDFRSFGSLKTVRDAFMECGSERARTLAEKIAEEERARWDSKEKFKKALSRVADVKPASGDEL